MRAPLTDVQNRIYGFIVEYVKEHNYPPTIREIRENFKYGSNNTVISHIEKMREKGYLTNVPAKDGVKARTLQLVDNVVGSYTIKSDVVSKAVATLKARGYLISPNVAVELLSQLNIRIY